MVLRSWNGVHASLCPPYGSNFAASGEITLQALERHPRSTALPAAPRQVSTLDIFDVKQNRLARIIALAAAGLFGEGIEALLDLRGRRSASMAALLLRYMYSTDAPWEMRVKERLAALRSQYE
jgi:hypothetical protein